MRNNKLVADIDVPSGVGGFRQLWSYVHNLLGIKLYLILATFTVVSVTEGIGITLLLPLLDHALQPTGEITSPLIANIEYGITAVTGFSSPLMLIGISVCVIVLRIILGGISQFSIMTVRYETVKSLRIDLLTKLLKSKWTYLSRMSHGSSLQHLIHSTAISGEAVNEGAQIITRGLVIIVHISIAAMLSWPLTLMIILVLFLVLLMGQRSVNKSGELGKELRDRQNELYTDTLNVMQAARPVKMAGDEDRWCNNYLQLQNKTNAQILSFTKIELFTRILFQFVGLMTIILFATIAIFSFQTPLPHVLVFALISVRLFPLVQFSAHEIQLFCHHLPSFGYVMQEIKAAENHMDAPQTVPAKTFDVADITLKNVCLESPSYTDHTLLNSLNLTLKAGSITALVGASGAGKSLAADILSGLIEPDRGVMKVGGIKLDETTVTAWRHHVGYVAQDPIVLNVSLRDNLRITSPEIHDDEIIKTLKQVHLEELLSNLPHGLNTIVGERGALLSGGERQRIALARELLKKPKLLILDEATNGLDPISSKHIADSLRALHGIMTILIISHRLATVKIADRIYVMEQGSIIEQGSWDNLLRKENGRLQHYQELEA